MKILVTGGAGYIGSVLVRQLLEKGYFVRVIDSLKWGGESLFDVMTNENFELYKGDIRNKLLAECLEPTTCVPAHPTRSCPTAPVALLYHSPGCARQPLPS